MNKTIEHIFKRFIALFSIILLLLPILNNIPAKAESTTKIYNLRNTTLPSNIHPDDWFKAFADGVTYFYWGYFHDKVVEHINNKGGFIKEKGITGGGKNGGNGRTDLRYT